MMIQDYRGTEETDGLCKCSVGTVQLSRKGHRTYKYTTKPKRGRTIAAVSSG